MKLQRGGSHCKKGGIGGMHCAEAHLSLNRYISRQGRELSDW